MSYRHSHCSPVSNQKTQIKIYEPMPSRAAILVFDPLWDCFRPDPALRSVNKTCGELCNPVAWDDSRRR
jgi:hypothetical protein